MLHTGCNRGMTKSLQRNEPKLNIKANYNFYLAKGDNYMRHYIGDIQVFTFPGYKPNTNPRNSALSKALKLLTSTFAMKSALEATFRTLLPTSPKHLVMTFLISFLMMKKSG